MFCKCLRQLRRLACGPLSWDSAEGHRKLIRTGEENSHCIHDNFSFRSVWGKSSIYEDNQFSPLVINTYVLRNWIQVRKVNFSSERVQAFSMKTLRIFQTSLIGFVHRVSSELRIWNSSRKRLYSLTAKIDFSDLYSISWDILITSGENWWTSYRELFPCLGLLKFLFARLACSVNLHWGRFVRHYWLECRLVIPSTL